MFNKISKIKYQIFQKVNNTEVEDNGKRSSGCKEK